MGGEEAVAGLHGIAQAYGLVVDGGDGLGRLDRGDVVRWDGRDERAELGMVHRDAVGLDGRRDVVGEHGGRRDLGGGRLRPPARARVSAGRASAWTVRAPGTEAAGKRGSVSARRSACTCPRKRGSTRATRSPAGTSRGGGADRRGGRRCCTSKPSASRSGPSCEPGTGGPVRMAVDRRTHSLRLTWLKCNGPARHRGGRHVGRGYRMHGTGNSLAVYARGGPAAPVAGAPRSSSSIKGAAHKPRSNGGRPTDRADSVPGRVRRSLRRSDLQAFPQVRAHDNGVQCRVAHTPYP